MQASPLNKSNNVTQNRSNLSVTQTTPIHNNQHNTTYNSSASTLTKNRSTSLRLSYVPSASSPNVKTVSSKIGSLKNINHTPKGGNVKILNEKVKVETKSKIGSFDNFSHKAGGGKLKIVDKNVEDKQRLKQVGSKCGSLQNVKHQPQGGNVKIVNKKVNINAKSKCGSLVGLGD